MAYATLRRSPLLLVLVSVLAACSAGGLATAGPATPVPATAGAATPVPATATAAATPASSTPEATAEATDAPQTPDATVAATAAATPVGSTDDVESLIPTEVGGITLTPESIDIDQFMDQYPAFAAMLGVLGKAPSDVSIVQAQGSNAQPSEIMFVQAFRVAGADATAFMDGMLEFQKVENDVAEPITIADKQLVVLGSPETDAQYKTYYYPYGDVIFRLAYNGDNFDEQMAALVSALP